MKFDQPKISLGRKDKAAGTLYGRNAAFRDGESGPLHGNRDSSLVKTIGEAGGLGNELRPAQIS